jgi:hypothetical protein
MASSPFKRIIAIDLGLQVNGIAIADSDEFFRIRYMNVIDTKDLYDALENHIIPHYITENTIVLLENIFMYRNFALYKIHKRVKGLFKNLAKVKCLLPSQKSWDMGKRLKSGKGAARKKNAQSSAIYLLSNVLHDDANLTKFNSFQPRNHDLADALMMAFYIHDTE